MISTNPFLYHPFTIAMAAGQSIVFNAMTSSRFPLDFPLLPLQLFFVSLDCTYHIYPLTRALMEYTPSARLIPPNPIRLPSLLSLGISTNLSGYSTGGYHSGSFHSDLVTIYPHFLFVPRTSQPFLYCIFGSIIHLII